MEKRGTLTIFDILSDNQKILFNNTYVFSKMWATSSSNKANPKLDMDTICSGRIIIGLVGGAITGNGIGGLVGVKAALFENYAAGCWD